MCHLKNKLEIEKLEHYSSNYKFWLYYIEMEKFINYRKYLRWQTNIQTEQKVCQNKTADQAALS